VDEEVTIRGTDLNQQNLSVMLGPVELPVTMQAPDKLKFKIDKMLIAAVPPRRALSITVMSKLSGTGKKRVSNAVIGNLVPTSSGGYSGPVSIIPGPLPRAFATINLNGLLLGQR